MAEVNLGAGEATAGFADKVVPDAAEATAGFAGNVGQAASCVSQVGWQALVCVGKVTAAILGCSR